MYVEQSNDQNLEKRPTGMGPPHEGAEKGEIGHSLIYDCMWNGQATKTWKSDLPEKVLSKR